MLLRMLSLLSRSEYEFVTSIFFMKHLLVFKPPVMHTSFLQINACQDLLTKHSTLVAEFLTAHYDEVLFLLIILMI